MFKKFIGDREGNFAIATAIGMIPILAGVGLSIDYADSVRSASNLQNALDSALVEIATNAPQGYSESELEKMGDEYFQSNLVSASAMAGVLDYLGVTAGSKGSLTFTGKGSTNAQELLLREVQYGHRALVGRHPRRRRSRLRPVAERRRL